MHAKLRTERIVSTTDRRRNLSSEKCDGRYRERSGGREMRALRAAFGRVLDHGQRDIELGRSHRGRESRTHVRRMDSYGSDGMSIGCVVRLATAVGELAKTSVWQDGGQCERHGRGRSASARSHPDDAQSRSASTRATRQATSLHSARMRGQPARVKSRAAALQFLTSISEEQPHSWSPTLQPHPTPNLALDTLSFDIYL
ncbi:hypothetical protein BVI434_850045 [Burkholderia vietnamiensis]|nr:hypothetical protein BVI434_850045 [Burkholderia vietnamiensis]